MAVSCQILINNPGKGHRPGHPVSGVIKYALNEPLQVKNVALSFIGKGQCVWKETRSSTNRTEIINCNGNEEYFSVTINVIDHTSDEVTIIPVGSYEFAFEFFLPKDIPPSFKDDIGLISYTLKLTFHRPGIFKFSKKFTTEVLVLSCIDGEAEPVAFGLEKTLTKPFSKRTHVVNLKGYIDKGCLTPEEKAHLNIVVTNDTNINIIDIVTKVIRYVTYTADSGQTNIIRTIINGTKVKSTSVPKNSIVNLSQEIPILTDMYSVKSKVITVEYKLKITVRLPAPYINASVEMPIVIGEKPSNEYHVNNPPSYWEVACIEDGGE